MLSTEDEWTAEEEIQVKKKEPQCWKAEMKRNIFFVYTFDRIDKK